MTATLHVLPGVRADETPGTFDAAASRERSAPIGRTRAALPTPLTGLYARRRTAKQLLSETVFVRLWASYIGHGLHPLVAAVMAGDEATTSSLRGVAA